MKTDKHPTKDTPNLSSEKLAATFVTISFLIATVVLNFGPLSMSRTAYSQPYTWLGPGHRVLPGKVDCLDLRHGFHLGNHLELLPADLMVRILPLQDDPGSSRNLVAAQHQQVCQKYIYLEFMLGFVKDSKTVLHSRTSVVGVRKKKNFTFGITLSDHTETKIVFSIFYL